MSKTLVTLNRTLMLQATPGHQYRVSAFTGTRVSSFKEDVFYSIESIHLPEQVNLPTPVELQFKLNTIAAIQEL